ncbi:hypothetical protein ABZ907_34155 [Nonomuraea wenchangensis]
MWNRPDVDFVQSQDVPWQAVAEGGFGAAQGGRRRLLSRDAGTGAETAIHRLTGRHSGVLDSAVDMFVIGGEGLLDGEPLRVGDYVYAKAGTALDLVASARGLTIYCGFWGPSGFAPGTGSGEPLLRIATEREPWVPAGWSGEVPLEAGAMSKVLRSDDTVFVYLAGMMPGWKSPMEEAHPQYEESFKIYGDVLMGPLGVIRAGGYFFRSPHVFHGPLYSRGGTMSFIRSDAAPTTEYRAPGPGGAWDELSATAYVD